MSIAVESLTFETPYLRLAAQAWGPADGVPVLAFHGWLDNSASFETLAIELLQRDPQLRLVAWDAPGHGHSQHRRDAGYHFIDWVADAAHLLDALGWSRAGLLGHSMGAGVAALLAGTLPERVSHLVMIEGLGPLSQTASEAPSRLARAIREEGRRRGAAPRRYTDFDAAVAKRAEVGAMRVDSAQRLLSRATDRNDEGYGWRSDPALRTSSRQYYDEESVRAYLRRISCPSLLVRAEAGWPHDPELLAGRAACIEGLQLETLAGHHHLHLDDPAPTAERICRFWAQATDPSLA